MCFHKKLGSTTLPCDKGFVYLAQYLLHLKTHKIQIDEPNQRHLAIMHTAAIKAGRAEKQRRAEAEEELERLTALLFT